MLISDIPGCDNVKVTKSSSCGIHSIGTSLDNIFGIILTELNGLWPNVFLPTKMSGDIRIITCMSVTD